MTSFWRRNLFRQTWHPSFEELLLSLDEPGARSKKIETHLRTCWSCQLARGQVTRVTSAYMEDRSASLAGVSEFPEYAVSSFERKLNKLALQSGSPAFLPAFARSVSQAFLPSQYPLRLAGMIVGALLIALVFRLVSAPPVSAKRILYEVRQAENGWLSTGVAPVFHERLELRRETSTHGADVVSWEIWRDPWSNRFRHHVGDSRGVRVLAVNSREHVELDAGHSDSWPSSPTMQKKLQDVPAIFAELQQFFARNDLNFEDPMSLDNFEAWSGKIPNVNQRVSSGVLANGEETYVLRAASSGPFAEDNAMSIEWTVRKRDWRPVGERLEFKTSGGSIVYTLGQLSFEVLAREAVGPKIFAAAVAPLPSRRSAAPALAPEMPVEAKEAEVVPSEGDLVAAEIEAWYSFHSVGACIGRPMFATRTGNGIEVRGIVEDERSKTAILEALRGMPLVTADILTVAEDRSAKSTQFAGEPIVTIELNVGGTKDEPRREFAAEDLLKQFFAKESCAAMPAEQAGRCIQHGITNFSQDVMLSSESVLAQAWALRQLAAWYSALRHDALRPSSRRLVEQMVRDHLASLHQAWDPSGDKLRSVLGPFASDAHDGNDPAASTVNTGWVATSESLCARVERTTNLMLGLFVETNQSVPDAVGAARDLSSEIAGLDALFPQLEADLGAEFSDHTNSLSSADQN